jgi:hypothetical protein
MTAMSRRAPAGKWGLITAPALYLAVASVLFTVVAISAYSHRPRLEVPGVKSAEYAGPAVFEGWVRFDAGWYRWNAEHEPYYLGDREQSSVAFFPAYSLAMRAVHKVVGGDMAAVGVLVTFLSGLAAVVVFHRWCRRFFDDSVSLTAVALLIAWPYAFYLFGAVYADAIFVASSILAFHLLERDQPLAAGLVGAIASAARPVGLAVVLGLVAVQLHRGARSRRDMLVLLSAGGFGGYVAYLAVRFHAPFAFATAEGAPGWDQRPGPHTWFKVEFFERIVHFPHRGLYFTLGIVLQAALAIGLLVVAPRVWRRLGWGYALYVVMVLGIPLVGSKDLQGLGRYALAAFPSFAVLGEMLSTRRNIRVAVLMCSSVVLLVLCSAYARGSYVA